MIPVDPQVEKVRSRQDFVEFVRLLNSQLTEQPLAWPNSQLPDFLEALAAWVEDMDGYYRNRGEALPDPPDWKTYASALSAARVYE